MEQYIESHKHLQVELIKWLDSLIPSNLGQVSALLRSHPTKGARASRLYSKPLGRFIEKWIDKFGLDHGIAPNHYSSRKAGSFRFLVGQKDEAKIRQYSDIRVGLCETGKKEFADLQDWKIGEISSTKTSKMIKVCSMIFCAT